MKRVSSFLSIIVVLLAFCGCSRENLSEDIETLLPQTTSSSFIENTDPPSPEAVTEEIRNFIPLELPFDPADYPLLKTPPSLSELLGDYPETFVFEEKEWTFTKEDDSGKHYVNDKNLYLSLSDSGSVSITDENIADVCIFYDENKKIEYFRTPDASYQVQMNYTENESGDLIGSGIIYSMIRKDNIRYYHECSEDGTLLSVRVETEDKKDGWITTRHYTFDPATDSLTHARIDIERENSPHAFSSEYDAEGKLWAQPMYIYYHPDEDELKDFLYVYDSDFNFWEKSPRIQE